MVSPAPLSHQYLFASECLKLNQKACKLGHLLAEGKFAGGHQQQEACSDQFNAICKF